MSRKKILLAIVLPIFFVGVLGVGYYFLFLPRHVQTTPVGEVPIGLAWKFPASAVKLPEVGLPGVPGSTSNSSIPVPGGIPQGLPVRLQIPLIAVDTSIEDAFITSDGQMQVPAGTVDVAWFALGPHPGQVGSAVIGGHFGIQDSVPFVFYNLDKLKVGDLVYILDDRGNTLTFIVRSTESFAADADATPVFTSSDGLAHLNLITCEGIWNAVSGNYPDRLVVFTDQVTSTGAAPSTALPVGTFLRTLSIGVSGADVTALQLILQQKKFLKLPPSANTGYFGALTSAAVSNYQASVGLPVVGIFGPLTRARLMKELTANSVLPNTGVVIGAVPSSTPPSPSLLQRLYATPLEGILTSLLLLGILFLAFEVIKQYFFKR